MKRFFPMILTLMLISTLAIAGCGGGNSGGNPGGTSYNPGDASTYTVGGISFKMHYAPSGSFNSTDDTGPCTLDGTVNVANPYWIAETEVTYALWCAVYKWATGDADMDGSIGSGETKGTYTFDHLGGRGGYVDETYVPYITGHETDPVTCISWRDALVWCNALTDYYNFQNHKSLACVYMNGSDIIRDSTNLGGVTVTVVSTAKGFRLPTSDEWELAARYQNGSTWTPGTYASGATASYTDSGATKVAAWYGDNSAISGANSTHPVGLKPSNGNSLGLYDMSGNVWEMCFDENPGVSNDCVIRGGMFDSPSDCVVVGYVASNTMVGANYGTGFRPVRTQ
ncbi:MAG TPA: hypothetical protein DDW65_09550 [Firmicutes bacterium]|nr:hypothetical protein [Bacillota bacterium]